ncbi:hypothetical protein G1K66_08470 [Tenacibaculum finnmarkense]|uniref:hypothetical protein n=1 Tax=Tenacibaculum finnmarkense TaxID=2781243 RepID=UPI001E374A03|nr:hypothetical protein [Tenacibaculum finnmarkense]MCD8430403.1 hypothetical protein [Tenacibaculum finnmarkense genomovar ulcerans]MCG8734000.1 hypothetical protein [Tenacibaculum finnmarkense]MCG8813294.1 hypothetical protein [Tenacibaculum finnmarkense]
MEKSKTLKIFKQISAPTKTGRKNEMKEVVIDGSLISLQKEVAALKKSGVIYFEVIDQKKQIKIIYKKLLSGVNYSKKVVKT